MIIRFHVRVGSGVLRVGMIGLLLAGPAGELCSEPVTMTSYYPAPSGTYSQIVVTQNSYLARDVVSVNNASMLAIGLGAYVPPGANTTKMLVAGNVGIGTVNPTSLVQVQRAPAGNTFVNMIVDGQVQTGESTNNRGGVWFNTQGPASMFVGQHQAGGPIPTSSIGFYNNTAWGLTVANNGNVGMSKNAPGATLDVGGTIIVRSACTTASIVNYTGIGIQNQNCPGGTYATWATGIYSQRQDDLSNGTFVSGSMFCCACPPTGCSVSIP
jgi:hypothetical protein